MSSRVTIWLAVVPAALLMAVFLGVPIVQGIILSFSRWSGIGPVHITGTQSYKLVFQQQQLVSSLWRTVIYAVSTAVLITVVATLLAAAVSNRVKGAAFYRVLWFLPPMAPAVVVGIFWSGAFQPTTGFVNVILGYLGLGNTHAWLAGGNTAIYPAIFATVWAGVGFAFLVILGATESVPVTFYEAAQLDGATLVRRFRSITLPLIMPVVGVVAMLEIIWAANGFTLLWAMTGGGPGYATSTLPVLIYREAFFYGDYGQASAMAVLAGVALSAIGWFMLRSARSRQEGGAG